MIWPSKVGMVGLSIKKNRKSISSQKNSKKGFTLVELIVVLVIIAIMAAAIAPALLGYIDHANEKKYIEKANECLKASQSVISDTYNDSSNSISMEKRYSAADAAKVKILGYNDDLNKKDGTSFIVWTSKQLVATGKTLSDGTLADGTKAIADNMGSYTVAYAAYDPGENVDKFFVYDGKEWTSKDKPDDGASTFKLSDVAPSVVASSYSDNIIYMWPFDADTAYADGKLPDTTDWENETDEAITKTVKFHLTSDLRENGVYFENGGSAIPLASKEFIEIEFSMDSTKTVTSDQCSSLTAESEIKQSGSDKYTLKLNRGFKNLRWSTSKRSADVTYSWDSESTSLLNQIFVEGVEEFYAYTDKETISKEVTFIAKNANTLSINGGSSYKVTLSKYDNEFDRTYSASQDLNTEAAGLFEAMNAVPAAGYELDKWGCKTTTTQSGYELTASNELAKYDAEIEDIWNKVFMNWPDADVNLAPTFVGNITMDKTAIFKADAFSEFKNNAGDLSLTYKYAEIPVEAITDTFERDYNNHPVVMNDGYQFLGWVDADDSTKTFDANGNEINDIKSYVLGLNKSTVTFNIRTKEIKGAKLTAESSDAFKTIVSGANYANVSLVIRDSYANGVSALGDLFTDCATNNNGVVTVTTPSGNHTEVMNGSGGINKFAILWDGNDEDYPVPVFAYGIDGTNGQEIHWFCFDNNDPDVYDDFSSTFSGFTNCVFAGSDIENWNMANCTSVASMFEGCKGLTSGQIDFSNWKDMSKVASMEKMFKDCNNIGFTSVDFSDANLQRLTTMANWVDNCANLHSITLDRVNSPILTIITNLTTNYVKDASQLQYFYARGWKAGSISSFGINFKEKYNLKVVDFSGTADDLTDLSGLTSLTNAFCFSTLQRPKGTASDISLNTVSFAYTNLSSVSEAKFMFVDRSNDVVDEPVTSVSFEGADLSSLRAIDGIFFHLFTVETINLDTSTTFAPSTCLRMFDSCTSLSSVPGLEKMNTSSVTTMENMFYRCNSMTSFDFTKFDYSHVENMDRMFAGAGFTEISFRNKEMPNLTKVRSSDSVTMFHVRNNYGITEHSAVETVDFSGCKMNNTALTNFGCLFRDCAELKNVYFNGFEAKHVTNISSIFNNCTSLIVFEGKKWDLSGATNLSNFLSGNTTLSTVDLSEANFEHVTSNYNIFNGCTSLNTVTLNGCNMSGITAGINSNFFGNCNQLHKVYANKWNVNSCNDMSNLFLNRTGLQQVEMTGMKIDKVARDNNGQKGFYRMFMGCTALTNVKMNVTTSNMNAQQQSLANMFNGCTSLTSVEFTDLDFGKVERFTAIFNNCTSYTKEDLVKTMSNWDYTQNTTLFSDGNHKAGVGYNSLFEVGKCHASLKTGTKQKIEMTVNEHDLVWEIDGTYPSNQKGHETRLNFWKDE